MTYPISPIAAQLHTDGLTGRKFRYDATLNAWVPERVTDLKELQDVSDTVPTADSKLVYSLSNLEYGPVSATGTPYVPTIYTDRDPTESDNAEVGTMWINEAVVNAVTAWVATSVSGANTFWKELAVNPLNSLFTASPTAPTDPEYGTIWLDSNTVPPTKKYWYNAWRTIA